MFGNKKGSPPVSIIRLAKSMALSMICIQSRAFKS